MLRTVTAVSYTHLAEAGMMFSDLLSGLERVADHATNIAFSLTEEDSTDSVKK